MNKDEILIRTFKGNEEVKSGYYKLAFKKKCVLVSIDGKKTIQDLMAQFEGVGKSSSFLDIALELQTDKFVEPLSEAIRKKKENPAAEEPDHDDLAEQEREYAVSPSNLSQTPPRPITESFKKGEGEEKLLEAKRYLVEFVNNILGDEGSDLEKDIYRCTNRAQLNKSIDACCDIVQALAGRKKAAEFSQEVNSIFS